jgi:hypothetical protein
VTACVREVERRGMAEIGIYRVSGSASDLGRLKKSFESSECQTHHIAVLSCKIHLLAYASLHPLLCLSDLANEICSLMLTFTCNTEMHGIYRSVLVSRYLCKLNRFSAFESLNINMGNIRENIKTLARDGLGQYGLVCI